MSASPSKSKSTRPNQLQTSKSFTRFEPSRPRSPKRSRASTLSNEVLAQQIEVSDPLGIGSLRDAEERKGSTGSIFEKPDEEGVADTPSASTLVSPTDTLPPDFDELPIEIASWTDRFINDLQSAKIYPTPPSADKLAEIFQEFYTKAEDRIGTHIKALASKQSRAASPAPSTRSATRPRPSPRLKSAASREALRRVDSKGSGQPMLTPSEVHEKRKARRLLEYKRIALEEAVERRVCEALYDKLWRHKSTIDDVRDEKLRGKTGSLQLVGVGLKELGIDLSSGGDEEMTSSERAIMVEEWVSKAAEGLLNMNEPHNPMGKLDSLIAAHQKIVDLLTKVHQGSSSADEILPTLIYCLLTAPAEGLNIVSNMTFIQRFRASSKMNGEAAYCLTNLEAAVTFLETVDLASLQMEESTSPNARAVVSQPATPLTAKFMPSEPAAPMAAGPATSDVTATAGSDLSVPSLDSKSRPSSASKVAHHRRLSSLMSFPSSMFNSASEARNNAEESLRVVSTTLDSSFKQFFGRFKEQQEQSGATDKEGSVAVPRTLDEAKKLVAPKPAFDDDGTLSENSSVQEADEDHPLKDTAIAAGADDKVLGLIVGRTKAARPRDRSADSRASDHSSVRKASGAAGQVAVLSPAAAPVPGALDNAAEAFRTFGNSFNPLNRLGGAGFMRGFGRTNTPPAEGGMPLPSPQPAEMREKTRSASRSASGDGEGLPIWRLDPPPRERFAEVRQASELRLSEVQELLDEYHRTLDCLKRNGLA